MVGKIATGLTCDGTPRIVNENVGYASEISIGSGD